MQSFLHRMQGAEFENLNRSEDRKNFLRHTYGP